MTPEDQACDELCKALTGYPLSKVVVFDTETTGLSPSSGDEVLSISICDAWGRDMLTSYVKPRKKRSWSAAQKVNGISPAMVANAPSLADLSDRIGNLLMGDVLVVGYNVSFDIEFLVSGGAIATWPMRMFDVMQEYASVYAKDGRWRKLTECAAHYGVSFGAHDASEDARATAACFRAMLADTKWCLPEARRIEEQLATVFTSQTKAAAENVRNLVSMGRVVCGDAELRLGAVTRGATKGTPRYEVYVDDLLVGTTSPSACRDVTRLLCVEEPLESIPCTATLSTAGNETRCVAKVTPGASLAKRVGSFAKRARGATAMKAPVPTANMSQSADYVQPAAAVTSPAKKAASGFGKVAGIVGGVWSRLPKWAKIIVVLFAIGLLGQCVGQ